MDLVVAMIDPDIEESIEGLIGEHPEYAVAYAILQLAKAQDRTADQIKALGLGNAASTMGAVEYLAVQVAEVAKALRAIADRAQPEGGSAQS
jgi:hypothetical protein